MTRQPVAAPDAGGIRRGILYAVAARDTSTVFVARRAELAALRDALDRATGDEPTTVLVGGEAGVGKTRLIEEFSRLAVAAGGRVLLGQCLELGEQGLPFAPFAAALRKVLREDGPEVFVGTGAGDDPGQPGYEPEFAHLLPELAKIAAGRGPGETGGPVPDTSPGTALNATRGYLFELVADLFGRLAATGPLVLVIEDLHWADQSTRDLVAFLTRVVRPARTLLICTYRSDELHRGHPLRPFLAELDRARGVERIDVGRLDRDGTAEILASLLGAEPNGRAVDNIHDRTQGNPFFIEELAAAGDPSGCVELPDTLRDLLLARVDRLPAPAQRVLRVAAAGGVRVAHDLLRTVAEQPEAELEEALRSAIVAQLLVIDDEGGPDAGYAFRHALVREAVHDDLLPGEHARMHARYAAAIEASPQLVAAGRAPAEVAHHWYAAHDHPKALVAAWAAAEAAKSRYAYAEQSRLLERVLDLWEQVPDAADRLGMDHLALLEETITAAFTAGDHGRALTLSRAALAEMDSAREPLRAARLLQWRGKLLRLFGKSDGAAELREAYRLIADLDDDPARVRLLADIASQMGWVDPAEGIRIAGEVMASARGLGDDASVLAATLVAGQTCGSEVRPESALPDLTRARDMASATRDTAAYVRAMVMISDALFELGRYAESAQAAADGTGDARRAGISRSTGAFLFSNQAEALVALGEWDEADALCAQAARLDAPGTLGLHWLQIRAGLRLARGHAGADDLIRRALAFLGRPYLAACHRLPLQQLRVEAALAVGDLAEAVTAARSALADGVDGQPRYGWPLLVACARAAVEAGDDLLRAQLTSVAAGLDARYPAEVAGSAQVRALFADPADAPDRWREAVAAWRTDGQPYQLACALLALAETAAGAGDRATAGASVTEAAGIAARLGCSPLRERLVTLARRVGLSTSPAGSGSAGPNGPGVEPLTGREREVLRLVAEGQSNSQIARHLFISPKTASVHVSRIIAKLAVTNRVEAAAVARRLGLLAPADDAADVA